MLKQELEGIQKKFKGSKTMQENDQKAKVYRISYEYGGLDKVERSQEVFSASAEQAKYRLEKLKQEHKTYQKIELTVMADFATLS